MRCPVCRADDNHTEQCRRCKADLTLLVRLERQRAACLASAERHAGRGETQACLTDAQNAHSLRGDSESLRLIALAALLKGDFASAWKAYQKRAKLV